MSDFAFIGIMLATMPPKAAAALLALIPIVMIIWGAYSINECNNQKPEDLIYKDIRSTPTKKKLDACKAIWMPYLSLIAGIFIIVTAVLLFVFQDTNFVKDLLK